jgi:ABC-2 type transport system permease protein
MQNLRDALLIYRRAMRLSLRTPVWMVFSLIQPVMYLLLFGPLLKQVAKTPGFPPGNEWQVFVPGLLVQLGIFGTLFVGFGLIEEIRSGVIERMRVSPVSRVALLLGRVLRDATVLLVQAAILTLLAIPFGLEITWQAVVGGLVIVALLGTTFASVSYAIAMVTKEEDALVGVLNFFSAPILLLSGILLPMTLAPKWLQHVSDINPIKHVVDGLRDLFHGDLTTATVAWSFAVSIVMAAVAVLLASRTFRNENA